MDEHDVIALLREKKDPLLDRFDVPPFDWTRPILRFRGGERGKFRSSITSRRGTEFYTGDPSSQRTLVAYNCADAILYALSRSAKEPSEVLHNSPERSYLPRVKGGRYDSVTGLLLPSFRFGYPVLLAIDVRPYIPDRIVADFLPGEVHILWPIDCRDVVVLFDRDKDLLGSLDGVSGRSMYRSLVQRVLDADRETV